MATMVVCAYFSNMLWLKSTEVDRQLAETWNFDELSVIRGCMSVECEAAAQLIGAQWTQTTSNENKKKTRGHKED